jgi:hypothetical protein
VISIVGNKLRTLHRVGKCWRVPGVHYQIFETISEADARSGAAYKRTCKDCFRKKSCKGGKRKLSVVSTDSDDSSENSSSSPSI